LVRSSLYTLSISFSVSLKLTTFSKQSRKVCHQCMKKIVPKTIDEYIARFPDNIRERLTALRSTIRKAAPHAEETVSYGVPAFKLAGMLVWFAAHKNHIGFYPRAAGIAAFKNELSAYKLSKGTVQFPFDRPLPLPLVSKLVKFRVKQNLSRMGEG
jgi:uncharacterized protein YdhG (YjbR/CyaY superfamily)